MGSVKSDQKEESTLENRRTLIKRKHFPEICKRKMPHNSICGFKKLENNKGRELAATYCCIAKCKLHYSEQLTYSTEERKITAI